MATTMIVMEVVTIVTGTKIVSVNKVLIRIHTNPVVRRYFRRSLQRSVPMAWRHCLQSISSTVFSL